MRHLPRILFQVVPHCKNRNAQVDDYFKKKDGWHFQVSKTSARYEFLVFVHALIEWFICEMNGIKEKDITKFDEMFEKERKNGDWVNNEEAGNDPRAPYQIPHKIATGVEMLLAPAIGVNWKEYEQVINNL